MLDQYPSRRWSDANAVLMNLAKAAGVSLPPETIEQRESYLRAAPLAGRRNELKQLMRHLKLAIGGHGRCCLLEGLSGVGKTRLLEEIRAQALVRDVLVLHGQAQSQDSAPYSVLRQAVLGLALVTSVTEEEAGILKKVFPEIEQVLRREVPDISVPDPESFADRLFHTVRGLIERYGKPVLLEIEDCHYLREDLTTLAKLSRGISKLPVLILASYRSDERPEIRDEFPKAFVLTVPPLDNEEVRQMSVSILGPSLGGNDALVSFLQRETEGNAF